MKTPNGLDEINATFGDIRTYIGSDGHLVPEWEKEMLDFAVLPFTLPLDWDRSVTVARMKCHKLMVPIFEAVFEAIVRDGFQSRVLTYGGCFAYRPQRTGNRLSAHAWGIAVDLNPSQNEQNTLGNMDAGIIQAFRNQGFKWGGDWQGKARDPMHFQFCTGY